jgi:hypothetical protein
MINKNNFFFLLIIFDLIFGVIFYNFIELNFNFSYTDEIIILVLSVYYLFYNLATGKYRIKKFFLVFILLMVGYLLYSFIIRINKPVAVFSDFLIFIKAFLAFFIIYELKPQLSKSQIKILRKLALITVLYCLIVGSILGMPFIYVLFSHPSRFATSTIACGLLYFYLSKFSLRTVFITIIIFCIGLLSTRSKMYGFCMLATILLIFSYRLNLRNKFKFSKKLIFLLIIILGATLFAARTKLYEYTIVGTQDKKNIYDIWARPLLYITGLKISKDFFPLGSGFASFGSWYSGVFYSPIYSKYGIDKAYGLTEADPSCVSDTFFPQLLGQFGVIGIVFFFLFWYKILIKIYNQIKPYSGRNCQLFVLMILIFSFFMVESIADSTIVENRGIFIMIIFAMAISELQLTYKKKLPIQ